MNGLVILMMISTTCAEFLATVHIAPYAVKYLPELTSAAALIAVVVLGIANHFRHLRPVYWLLLGLLASSILCGALSNHLEPGPLFAGIRSYLRPVPLFLLPAVYTFTEAQLRKQLFVLLGIGMLQFPISIFQRFSTLAAGNSTGDRTSGTLLLSGFLSIFLISVACVLTAAYMKGRIRLSRFLPLFLILIFPTMINETKATIFLLPIGIIWTFVSGSAPGTRLKNGFAAVLVLTTFGAIFVPVYDYLVAQGHGFHNPTIVEFLSGNRMTKYMDTGHGVGTKDKVGRLDGLEVPLEEIAKDPVPLIFGLGIGNASNSALGQQFTGHYFSLYAPFIQSAGSTFILEIGVLGLSLVLLLYLAIFMDSRFVAGADEGLYGILGTAWSGITIMILITTFYTNIDLSSAISFLFWYVSGLVAARRSLIQSLPASTTAALRGRPGPRTASGQGSVSGLS